MGKSTQIHLLRPVCRFLHISTLKGRQHVRVIYPKHATCQLQLVLQRDCCAHEALGCNQPHSFLLKMRSTCCKLR